MENKNRADRKKQEDIALTRALIWFGAAMVLEFLLLLVDKYYVNFVVGTASIAMTLDVVLKVIAVAGPIGAVLCAVWNWKRVKAGEDLSFAGVVIAATLLAIGASAVLLVTFRSAMQLLYLLVPAGAVLALVYYLYQREFFFSACGVGVGLLGLWLMRKHMGAHDLLVTLYVVAGTVLLAAILLLVLKLKKVHGLLHIGGRSYEVLPKKSNFILIGLSCVVSLAAMLAGLLLGSTVAFYLLFVLLSWLCVLLVYYTVKMM